jgi:hypothetical protein
MLKVLLQGDPFSTYVDHRQVEKVGVQSVQQVHNDEGNPMATATKPSAKELRKQAKSLGVEGWDTLSRDELVTAIKTAKGTARSNRAAAAEAPAAEKPARATKKAPATKKAAPVKAAAKPASTNGVGPNPYKEGTKLWHITEELMKGGKRPAMVARLKRKITLSPRVAREDWDEEAELDRRLLIIGQILERDHGFTVTHDGRGREAGIKATPAGG